MYKKINSDYNNLLNKTDIEPDILTRCLAKRNKAHTKSRDAANASNLANRRAKHEFYNSINSTMNNCNISAKKKFGILLNLMKKQQIFWHITIK